MSETLRLLINQRLTAAAEEIFGLFERTLAEYQKEPKGHGVQEEAAVKPGLLLPKTEIHELWTSQQGDQLPGLENADIKSTFNHVPVETKEEDEETPQPSWLQHNNVEHLKTEAVGKFCSGREPDRNLDSGERLSQDMNDGTPSCVELETDDSDNWREGSGRTIGKKSFSCYECGIHFSQRQNLEEHRKIHKEETPFRCFLCGKGFAQTEGLQQHMSTHIGEKLFSCTVCNETFPHKSLLVCHMASHAEETPNSHGVCGKEPTCDYPYNKQQTLGYQSTEDQAGQTEGNGDAMDMNTESEGKDSGRSEEAGCRDPDRNLQPEVNDETSGIPEPETEDSDDWQEDVQLQSRSNSLSHKSRSVFEEKPFGCAECGKRYSFKGNLSRHRKVHSAEKTNNVEKAQPERPNEFNTGEKPFVCSHCRKRYKKKEQLARHMQCHTKEKQYSCDVCQVRFTWNYQFRKHRCRGPKPAQLHGSRVEESGQPQPLVTDGDGKAVAASEPERNLTPATNESASHSFDSGTDDSQDWEDMMKS